MSFRFDRALVRPPAANFAEGLTTAGLGAPDVARALEQHAEYCRVLERCGLALTRLDPDPRHPDSTFVEDTAVVVGERALLTRPGAPSRMGEVTAVAPALARELARIVGAEGRRWGADTLPEVLPLAAAR